MELEVSQLAHRWNVVRVAIKVNPGGSPNGYTLEMGLCRESHAKA